MPKQWDLFLSPCENGKFSIETHMQEYEFMFIG